MMKVSTLRMENALAAACRVLGSSLPGLAPLHPNEPGDRALGTPTNLEGAASPIGIICRLALFGHAWSSPTPALCYLSVADATEV